MYQILPAYLLKLNQQDWAEKEKPNESQRGTRSNKLPATRKSLQTQKWQSGGPETADVVWKAVHFQIINRWQKNGMAENKINSY